jgi:hypothetical protein
MGGLITARAGDPEKALRFAVTPRASNSIMGDFTATVAE